METQKNRRWGVGQGRVREGAISGEEYSLLFLPKSLLLKPKQQWWEREQLTGSECGGDSFNLTRHLTYLNVNTK